MNESGQVYFDAEERIPEKDRQRLKDAEARLWARIAQIEAQDRLIMEKGFLDAEGG